MTEGNETPGTARTIFVILMSLLIIATIVISTAMTSCNWQKMYDEPHCIYRQDLIFNMIIVLFLAIVMFLSAKPYKKLYIPTLVFGGITTIIVIANYQNIAIK